MTNRDVKSMVVYLHDLYLESLTNTDPFHEEIIGTCKLSVTHKQCTITEQSPVKMKIALLDGISDIYSKIFCNKSFPSIVISPGSYNKVVIMGGELKKHKPVGTESDDITIDIMNLDESMLFQLSTVREIPDISVFEKIQKYYESLYKFCSMYKKTLILNLSMNWDDIFSTGEEK